MTFPSPCLCLLDCDCSHFRPLTTCTHRTLFLQPRSLLNEEVAELVAELRRDTDTEVATKVMVQLMSMGFTEEIAQWAATGSEGATIEDRVISALSRL